MDEKATEAYGYNRGLEEGTQRGSKKEKEEIAKKLKQEGIEIEVIEKVTNLTKEEIEELR